MSESRIPRKAYEQELRRLQARLVDMQAWVKSTGARIVVIFEGRDAAGKGSTITVSYTHLTLPTTERV